MDAEGVRIRFLRLKMDKNRQFFVWGPFSEAICLLASLRQVDEVNGILGGAGRA